MINNPPHSGKYGVIYADPPWRFEAYNITGRQKVERHYNTMTKDELLSLPVRYWAGNDCALFMWVVDSNLEEAINLMKAWGFQYKTIAFIWGKAVKDFDGGDPRLRMSTGYWTRKQGEICLLGTRGRPKRLGKGVRQFLLETPREHSRKPDEIRSRIEQLVNAEHRLELFAREHRKGWDVWGNETTKFETKHPSPAEK